MKCNMISPSFRETVSKYYAHISENYPVELCKNKTADRRYFSDNQWFNETDARIMYQMLSDFMPQSIMEIGTGFTTALMMDWESDLMQQGKCPRTCLFIDPDQTRKNSVVDDLNPRHFTYAETLQGMWEKEGKIYDAGEVGPMLDFLLSEKLFISMDGSHIFARGSDVDLFLNEILSHAHPGTLIHIHDIFYPDYPESFPKEWNELQALNLFMAGSDNYTVVMWNDYLYHHKIISGPRPGSIYLVKR